MKKGLVLLGVLIIATFLMMKCKPGSHPLRYTYNTHNELLHASPSTNVLPYLKVHLNNGSVGILTEPWVFDTLNSRVTGKGTYYNYQRVMMAKGDLVFQMDSVALYETNETPAKNTPARVAAMTILTSLDIGLGVYCLVNPKACFGSCPTFYLNKEDNFHYADAEGFSTAIAPSLEYFDIDALHVQKESGETLQLTMKNEALETHCVNDLAIWACEVGEGESIAQSMDNEFYSCGKTYDMVNAVTESGKNILDLVNKGDKVEWFSLSDEDNLSHKEELIFTFKNVSSKQLGLKVSYRQTLITTYMIYSAMGYMGDEVGDVFAEIERSEETNINLKEGIKKELGGISVSVWSEAEQKWLEQYPAFYETGPIAINHQILPFETPGKQTEVKVKLNLNKGLWRIDQVELTEVIKKVAPQLIKPSKVLVKDKEQTALLNKFEGDEDYLISLPGNAFDFHFDMPETTEAKNYELFLYSKGYYLEWMRDSWLKDKDLLKLKQMIDHPKRYLKSEAQNFKLYEAEMEEVFWNSKVESQIFSDYEN